MATTAQRGIEAPKEYNGWRIIDCWRTEEGWRFGGKDRIPRPGRFSEERALWLDEFGGDWLEDGQQASFRFHVTEREWSGFIEDCTGEWMDYHGDHPELKGHRTAFKSLFTGETGTDLLIEGLHFVIE